MRPGGRGRGLWEEHRGYTQITLPLKRIDEGSIQTSRIMKVTLSQGCTKMKHTERDFTLSNIWDPVYK